MTNSIDNNFFILFDLKLVKLKFKSLSTKRVKRCLQFLGLAYTEDAICRSELRVLMTLQFSAKSRHTPVTYVETLLSILSKCFSFI